MNTKSTSYMAGILTAIVGGNIDNSYPYDADEFRSAFKTTVDNEKDNIAKINDVSKQATMGQLKQLELLRLMEIG